MTLDEHDAQLKAEGKWDDYVARKQARVEAFELRRRQLREAQAPLVHALHEAGIPVKSVSDLINVGSKRPARSFRISTDPPEPVWAWVEAHGGSYASLLPLLMEHLKRPYPDAIRAAIARAVAIPEARPYWDELVAMYREEAGGGAKDGLAVAISEIATDDVMDELLALMRDTQNGETRGYLLCTLERSRDPRALQALQAFTSDPVLGRQARISLRLKTRAGRRKRS